MNSSTVVCLCPRLLRLLVISVLFFFFGIISLQAATNRSAYIPYDSSWISAPDYKLIAFDSLHQQVFTGWTVLDRIDVLSAADYHLIRSISVPAPSSLDISPDGNTLAVGTSSAHILFFDTGTFVKTNDIVFPDSALGITAFVYTANGNAFIRGAAGLSTGGGITAYWDHTANSFVNESHAGIPSSVYQTTGPLARSGDYSRILLGDATTGGAVQILDGNTGQSLQVLGVGGYILALAANKDASRYAVCVEPAGYGPFLVVLDASFNELYQDEAGCSGMVFSADGGTLYRDASVNSVGYTQSIDMTTFSARNTENYFSHSGGYSTAWQAADGTGMVYGVNPNVSSGAIFVAVDTTVSTTPSTPALNDPVHIVRVIDNVGSPQGGDLVQILCTGADTASTSSISVTVGGVAATGLAVAPLAPSSNLPNLRIVSVKSPSGTPGLVDVTLSVAGTSDTAVKAFQYVRSTQLFPFSTNPTFLLYDSFRKKLYAAHKDQVEVIDPLALEVLAPLVPASGKLPNSQFAGMSLSRDGSHLYIADAGAMLIHVLDLNNPGAGTSLDPNKAIASSNPISPARVVETSDGKLLASGLPAWPFPFTLDPNTGTGTQLVDSSGNKVGGFVWASSKEGEHVLISSDIDEPISSRVAMWNASTSVYTSSANETAGIIEATANEDGTIIVTGGSNAGGSENPEIVDFNLNSMGFINQHFDISMPIEAPTLTLHPSGALLYQGGTGAEGGSVEIDDVHQLCSIARIVFPEPFVSYFAPLTDHVLATDDTGRYFFGVTKSGITMMVLDTLPLSIGNIQPSFGQPAGGQTATIRGSGFQSGAVVTIGGSQISTTFVDENTLTVQLPALSSGWQDVIVKNSNGDSYTAPGLFQVLPVQPQPVITGFSPASVTISLSEYPLPITIVGSGFEAYDTVEINGQPIDSALVDSSHMQATIPYSFSGTTGSVPITIVSPFTGSSNTLSIPLVNPIPVIDSILPATLATGTSNAQFTVWGRNFVAGTVAQWNGQNLTTTVAGGLTNSGEEILSGYVPANLLTNSGTAAINILNPTPGGGKSNTVSMDISPAHPVVSYPQSVAFGTVLLGTVASQTIQLENVGSASYTVSSITVTSGPFS
ncbi:MAG TPA: IPT/TIG domain-containing protein, partial [Terriglobia bacterium]|nr:IPT/TIG domain-containing protein [Terriglobia bacterium]